MKILPVMMIRNEENYIAAVVQPLINIFGKVLIADTGSKDRTVEILRDRLGVELITSGNHEGPDLSSGLTFVRQWLTYQAKERGYDYIFLVDGDELYDEQALDVIARQDIPEGTYTGFTRMRSLERDEATGEYWIMDDLFSRMALYSTATVWKGIYPYESPEGWEKRQRKYYSEEDKNFYHALHLHRLVRSSLDAQVPERVSKQFKYSMQDLEVPRWKVWYPKSEAELRLSGTW